MRCCDILLQAQEGLSYWQALPSSPPHTFSLHYDAIGLLVDRSCGWPLGQASVRESVLADAGEKPGVGGGAEAMRVGLHLVLSLLILLKHDTDHTCGGGEVLLDGAGTSECMRWVLAIVELIFRRTLNRTLSPQQARQCRSRTL